MMKPKEIHTKNKYKKKNNLKILHVIQGKHFGGAEQVVLTLAKTMHGPNVQVNVCCLHDGLLLERLRKFRIPSYFIKMGSQFDVLIPVHKLKKLITSEEYDIVHTHSVRSNLVGRLGAFISGVKSVTHIHSPVERDFEDKIRCKKNYYIDLLTEPIARHLITVSNSLRNEKIKRGKASNRITTIHNALDINAIKTEIKNTKKSQSIRSEFNIPASAFIIVLVALLRPRKGIQNLILAAKNIIREYPNTYILIVGNDDISEDISYGKKLRKMAQESYYANQFIFTGFRQDVYSILKQCNLFVLPSLFGEGLPMVILEAMACRLPVVATRNEGIPEIIEDGVNGFLVEPGNIDELYNKIKKVMARKPLLKESGKCAQETIEKYFNIKKQAEKVLNVYMTVINDG